MFISVVSRLAYQASRKTMKEAGYPEVQLLVQESLAFCFKAQENNHPIQVGLLRGIVELYVNTRSDISMNVKRIFQSCRQVLQPKI